MTMNHIKPPKSPCSHRVYQMDCAEYDRLLAHAEGRCQICRAVPQDTKHGFLVVDHDATVGQWAVRGLLCTPCNTNITVSPSFSPEFDAYMSDPWWRRSLAEQGLSPEIKPEPPVGTEVTVMPNRRRWRREGEKWRHMAGYRSADLRWGELNRRFGPHRILVPAQRIEPDARYKDRADRLRKTTAPERPAASEEQTA
jgi:hypothetical protein